MFDTPQRPHNPPAHLRHSILKRLTPSTAHPQPPLPTHQHAREEGQLLERISQLQKEGEDGYLNY